MRDGCYANVSKSLKGGENKVNYTMSTIMKNTDQIQYLAVVGNTQSPDNPSAVVRRILTKDNDLIEYCTPVNSWRPNADLYNLFIGLDSRGWAIEAHKAMQLVNSWSKNWPDF